MHLVCVTKYRKGVLTNEALKNIELSFETVCKKMDMQLLEFNGETDHIHAVIEYPPKLSVSVIVNALKGVSSRYHKKAGYPRPSEKSLWSPSYYASAVGGAPLDVLMEYVKNQDRPEGS